MTNEYLHYKNLEPFWGSWRICDFIGEGSYGKVFKIEKHDISGSYYAAMKIISVHQSNDIIESVRGPEVTGHNRLEYYRNVTKNIANEFKLMEQLKGTSNIVCYEDHEIREYNDGIDFDIFIRMELLTPINEHFKLNPPSEDDIIRLGIDVCKALEICANHNIIHRDVKPGNLFISKDNNYKLGDFGIAKTMEQTNSELSKKGTYDYMAPEVYKGEQYGAAADIYSLGIVLYKYMNDGRAPFLPPAPAMVSPMDEDISIRKRISFEEVPKPCNASEKFGEIISKACAGDYKKRYQSAAELRKELQKLIDKRLLNTGSDIVESERSTVITNKPKNGKNATSKKGGIDITVKVAEKQSETHNALEEVSVNAAAEDRTVAVFGESNAVYVVPEKPASKSNKFVVIALVVAGLLILGGVAALIASHFSKESEDSDYQESTAPAEVWEVTGYEEKYPFYAVETKYVDGEETGETRVNTEKTKYTEEEAKLYYLPSNTYESSKRILYLNGVAADYIEYTDEMADEEWVIEGCDADYREYARKYINGEKTEETQYTGAVYDKYVYIAPDGNLFYATYGNGRIISYTPTMEIGEEAWVVTGKTYEKDSYREIAIKYVDGVPTDETKLTGYVYDTFAYTVKNTEDNGMGNYYRVLYVNGNPTDKKEYINKLSEEEWIISGYDEFYQEYAILYKDGFAEEETRYTGKTVTVEEWRREEDGEYYYERKFINGVATEECRNFEPKQQGTTAAPSGGNTSAAQRPGTTQDVNINFNPYPQSSSGLTVNHQQYPQINQEIGGLPGQNTQLPPANVQQVQPQPQPQVQPQPQAPVAAYTAEVLDEEKYAWYLVSYDANGNEISRSYLKAAYKKTDRNGNTVWS